MMILRTENRRSEVLYYSIDDDLARFWWMSVYEQRLFHSAMCGKFLDNGY